MAASTVEVKGASDGEETLPNIQVKPNGEEKTPSPSGGSKDKDGKMIPRHRFLPPREWALLARGVGAVRDSEQNKPVHPAKRTTSFYLFHAASISRWMLMIIQIFIGAALTALGPQSFKDGTPITVLGAVNTIIAGLLALLHNSGLPDRYRYNMAEFAQLEDDIRELLDTKLAPTDQAIDQVLANCFDRFQVAKATVQANMPVTYNSKQKPPEARKSGKTTSNHSPDGEGKME